MLLGNALLSKMPTCAAAFFLHIDNHPAHFRTESLPL